MEHDAKSKMISVDKGGDVWEFSTEGIKGDGIAGAAAKINKGDKVPVYYRMRATKIEGK